VEISPHQNGNSKASIASSEMILHAVCHLLFLSFLGTPHVTYADDDRCPQWGDLEGFQQQGLKRGRYLGRWFRQRAYSTWSDIAKKCHSKYYSRKYMDNPFDLVSTNDYVSSITGLSHSSSIDVRIEDRLDPTLFTPAFPLLLKQRYRVIATDYDTFTIEYSCSDTALLSKNENVWILTRKRRPSRRIKRKALRALRGLGVGRIAKLIKSDQKCPEQELSKPPLPVDAIIEDDYDYQPSIRRNIDHGDFQESGDLQLQWISPASLARDFMGSLAKAGQAIFAPWTLPGQPFSAPADSEYEYNDYYEESEK